eukprot:g975.t1
MRTNLAFLYFELASQVVGPLYVTNRISDFEYKGLQMVMDGKTRKVAVDAVGCNPGDWVVCLGSAAAREAAGHKQYPSDLTIVGIIDYIRSQDELGLRRVTTLTFEIKIFV